MALPPARLSCVEAASSAQTTRGPSPAGPRALGGTPPPRAPLVRGSATRHRDGGVRHGWRHDEEAKEVEQEKCDDEGTEHGAQGG